MAPHPELQERVVAEIESVLGDEEPDYDNVKKLGYLDMCVSETPGMYPPAVRFNRSASADYVISGVKIPKGMAVGIPIYAIHHDPERWENPEVFYPERFNAKNKSKHGPFDYLPFGQGPGNCIGMRLGLMETVQEV